MRMFSVIIPAFDEEARIQDCLRSVLSTRAELPVELVVADGGSGDRTIERAQTLDGVTVVRSARGRARQQNAGMRATTGDVLLFLHADCRLQPGALAALESLIARRPECPGGAFRMRIDGEGRPLRVVEWLSHARLRLAHVACGDQGIWAHRSAFRRVGGFREQPLMEDVEFSRALARLGPLGIVEEPAVLSSARRFLTDGVLRRTLSNWSISLAWALGADVGWLKRFYADRDGPVAEADPAA